MNLNYISSFGSTVALQLFCRCNDDKVKCQTGKTTPPRVLPTRRHTGLQPFKLCCGECARSRVHSVVFYTRAAKAYVSTLENTLTFS